MKIVTKEKKEKSKTVEDLEVELQALEGRLEVVNRYLHERCDKCDGTGRPKTKNGEPAKGGYGNVKCKGCSGTGMLNGRLDPMEKSMTQMKKDITRIGNSLKAHVNKQSVEIRVWEKNLKCEKCNGEGVLGSSKCDGEMHWGDYSGVFDLNDDEEKSIVMDKARSHYETYLKSGFYHRNKKLGIFLSNPRSGKHLIEELATEE